MSLFRSYLSFVIINIALICLINAQITKPGKCPENIKAIEDFNAAKYLGKWYEHERYPFSFEEGGSCSYAIYGTSLNKNIVTVLNSQINLNKERTNVTGTAELTEGSNVGKLLVQFDKSPVKPKSANYWILETDYTSYSVVYSCTNIGNIHATIVWVLTRDRIPSEETLSKVHRVIDANQISNSYFVKTIQTGCPADEH